MYTLHPSQDRNMSLRHNHYQPRSCSQHSRRPGLFRGVNSVNLKLVTPVAPVTVSVSDPILDIIVTSSLCHHRHHHHHHHHVPRHSAIHSIPFSTAASVPPRSHPPSCLHCAHCTLPTGFGMLPIVGVSFMIRCDMDAPVREILPPGRLLP